MIMENCFARFAVRDQAGVEEGIPEERVLGGGPGRDGDCVHGAVGGLQLLRQPVRGLVQDRGFNPRHCSLCKAEVSCKTDSRLLM